MTSTNRTTNRPLVIASIMASMAMVAIEATIVSTVMPQIASELGGLHLYSWVFASFLLAQTAMTVVFGKLSDLYGRRPIFIWAVSLFLVASALCGLSQEMWQFILFRGLQGLGGGAVFPVALAVVARTMPQMNIFIVAMPLKVAVGLFVMALAMRELAPLMQRVFGALPAYWRAAVF